MVLALTLICAACGSTDKKEKNDAVAKSEEVKNEKEESEAQEVNTEKSEATDAEKGNNESNDWITEWIKSESSDDEICAVGSVETTKRFWGEAMTKALMDGKRQLCILQSQASGNYESSKHTDSFKYSFKCNLPAKTKGLRQSMVNKNGYFSIYALVCIDRKDLEGNTKESEKEISETDNTDVADTDATDKTDQTDKTDKTDEDKVVQ